MHTMTTLHLQTDLGSNSASSFYSHGHGHPGIPRCPNEADYAAVTPTAARPHPERAALFEGVYGSRPAPLHQPPPAGVMSMEGGLLTGSQLQHEHQLQLQPGYGVQYQQQQQQQQQLHSTFAHHVLQNTRSSSSSTCPSESESSSESAPSAGGPPTPPSSNAPSSLSISRGASPAIPGNTIYTATAYRHAPHQQQQQYSMHLAFPGSQMVAAPTQPYGHTYIQPAQAQPHCADYSTATAPQYSNYASNQLTYTPYLGSSYYASHRPTPPRAFRGAHFWRDLFPWPFIGTFDCRGLFHLLLTLPISFLCQFRTTNTPYIPMALEMKYSPIHLLQV